MKNDFTYRQSVPQEWGIRLSALFSRIRPDRLFFVTDSNMEKFISPLIRLCTEIYPQNARPHLIVIPAGEENKNLSTLTSICNGLSNSGATRHSMIINFGGGMVSDIGGFAAAIFKRGISYINVATTLLAAVDASIGGKTGVDIRSGESDILLKNELGAFHNPELSLIDAYLFKFLPHYELLSGYGEVIKTAMLFSTGIYRELLNADQYLSDPESLTDIAEKCAQYKREITRKDPTEQGLRRILNLGHTLGHAIESRLIERGTPYPHGICVAYGLLATLVMSHICCGLPSDEIYLYKNFLVENFPSVALGCEDIKVMKNLMLHDKKNRAGQSPSFVLIRKIADPVETYTPSDKNLAETLDIFRELTGN